MRRATVPLILMMEIIISLVVFFFFLNRTETSTNKMGPGV